MRRTRPEFSWDWYEWVDMFRPERVHPRWSFEHASKRRVRALVITLWRALFPGKLWRHMRLAAPIRVGRLVILAIVLLPATHLAAVGAACAMHWSELWIRNWAMTSPSPTIGSTFDWDAFATLLTWPYEKEWERLIGPLGLLLIVWGVLVPMPYLILEQTMAAAKVRRAHLFRGWVYFLVPICCIVILDVAMMAFPQAWYQRTGTYWMIGWRLLFWNTLGVILFLGTILWLVRWWLLFTRLYLQLARPRRIVAVMLTISFLAALAICLGIDEQMRYAVGTPLDVVSGWWKK